MVKATVELKINQAMISALFNDADKVAVDSANSLAKEMKKRIKTGAKSGKTYGNHTSYAPGQSPANWTGELVNSILLADVILGFGSFGIAKGFGDDKSG